MSLGRLAFRGFLLGVTAYLGFCFWLIAPRDVSPLLAVRTAGMLAQAPFADRIAIGDSRIEWAKPSGDALFAGFSSATTGELMRFTKVICAISPAPVSIALGVNDTQAGKGGPEVALANLGEMARACADDPLAIAEVWPVEPEKEPVGQAYDPEMIAQINRGLTSIAEETGARIIPAPAISGHTFDGVHLNAEAAELYLRDLVGEGSDFTIRVVQPD